MASPRIYVVQVMGGREERVRTLMLRLLPEVVEECFTPSFESKRKVRGEWRTVTGLLFPGYVFVLTAQPRILADRLRGVPQFTRLLGMTERLILALTDEEVAWLNAFTNAKTHVVEMSEGIIEGDRVLVTRGPLRGHEAEIVHIDRHKRVAVLEITMFGRLKQVRVGLEIVMRRAAPHEAPGGRP